MFPSAGNGNGRRMHSGHTTHLPDERSGATPETHQHTSGGNIFRHAPERSGDGLQQRGLRKPQVSLCLARTSHDRRLHRGDKKDESLPARYRRVTLHLSMGLRLPSTVSQNRRDPPLHPQYAGTRPHRHRHTKRGRRHSISSRLQGTKRLPNELRTQKRHI